MLISISAITNFRPNDLVMEGKRRYFSSVDWRYNEFPNPAAHMLHCTCVEIMAIPVVPNIAGNKLLDAVVYGRSSMESRSPLSIEDMESWFSGTGLILVSLPDSYWLPLHDRLKAVVDQLQAWPHKYSPLTLFNFKTVFNGHLFSDYANLLAITHSVWHHLGSGHVHHIQT